MDSLICSYISELFCQLSAPVPDPRDTDRMWLMIMNEESLIILYELFANGTPRESVSSPEVTTNSKLKKTVSPD